MGWIIFLVYIAGVLLTYKVVLPRCYRKARTTSGFTFEDIIESHTRESAPMMALWRASIWPLYWLLGAPIVAFHRWTWQPIEKERERIAQLRYDREAWHRKYLTHSLPAEEREMAATIRDALDEILRREGA
jgi:hypothetical protein